MAGSRALLHCKPSRTAYSVPLCMQQKPVAHTMVPVLLRQTLQCAGGVALNASQPAVVAVSAVAVVLVFLAVHTITVGLALPVNAVAACNAPRATGTTMSAGPAK